MTSLLPLDVSDDELVEDEEQSEAGTENSKSSRHSGGERVVSNQGLDRRLMEVKI